MINRDTYDYGDIVRKKEKEQCIKSSNIEMLNAYELQQSHSVQKYYMSQSPPRV